MALSSSSKKSNQSDSDYDFDDELRDELPFLHQENERLGLLLDNCDDMLREAKKMRKEPRASVDGVYSYQTSYGFASGQIPRRSQGTLLPSSGEPKVSNL
jgi:hypothetical protein